MPKYLIFLLLLASCKATHPVQYSPIQNDRYYAINQTTMPLYVIRYETWTVEETDVHDIRDPKFNSELEAEEIALFEIGGFMLKHIHDKDQTIFNNYEKHFNDCRDRIQKLKQQSI